LDNLSWNKLSIGQTDEEIVDCVKKSLLKSYLQKKVLYVEEDETDTDDEFEEDVEEEKRFPIFRSIE